MNIEFNAIGKHEYTVSIDGKIVEHVRVIRKTMKMGVRFKTTFNITKNGETMLKKLRSLNEVKAALRV